MVSVLNLFPLGAFPAPEGNPEAAGRGGRSWPCPHAGVPVPHHSWVCPPAPSLQLLQNVGFVLICICEAFHKLQQCLRELCLGLHGLGAGKAQELAGMVQILHVDGWELIQGGWEEEDDQREKLGSL